MTIQYRDPGDPDTTCPSCIAWSAEVQRVSLLLERLAEDHFPDQEAFDRWMSTQMTQVFRARRDT